MRLSELIGRLASDIRVYGDAEVRFEDFEIVATEQWGGVVHIMAEDEG